MPSLGVLSAERGFGLRLVATVVLTFVAIAAVGYTLLERELAHRQISELAAVQKADAGTIVQLGSSRTPRAAFGQIGLVLHTIGGRPGMKEATLIAPDFRIFASASPHDVGAFDRDARIAAAIQRGETYSGHESDPRADRRDFEFVTPVVLDGRRYAFELTYDHRAYDSQMAQIRETLILIGLLTLVIGGAVFYLLGGRRLMADHRSVAQRATRDGLTDLPNQRAFEDELPQTVASAHRYGEPLALALLDVDDFKLINDRHGHPHGDAVLRRVAAILAETRTGDRPYRVGGDEFALLLSHTDAEGARTLARRLHRGFVDAGVKVTMGVSALRPGVSADTLRAEADTALYEAKREGGDRIAHYEDVRDRVVVTTSEKKEAVLRLLEERRLQTLYQPIWSLDSGRLLAVEALSRPDPCYGLSGPAEAFDIAEQLGRVHQLDVVCVESALRSAPELEPGALLFLNISPLTLDLDAAGDDWLGRAVDAAGLAPDRVVVEVTERFGGRTASVVKCLRRLREQGFRIAVDDVGTGNSGLEILSSLHAEFVKLDRSVVAAAATEPGARAVLMAMATFARQTGSYVIAEGIEDDETLDFLRSLPDPDVFPEQMIQGGQGFGLGRPSPELSPPVPGTLQTPALGQLVLDA
jgi:diguanylate cyclase (GGDEF)-like protein